MKLLPKQIWEEEFHYYSQKSVDELKNDIQQLFEQTKGWNFSVNLTGKFTRDNEFKMTPKWQFATIQSFEREISYLSGRIFKDEFQRTRVAFTVRPNSIFLIFFFLFPIIGIFALAINSTNDDIYGPKILGFVFILIVPLLMLLFGHFAKQGIKDRFIKTFDLKPVHSVQGYRSK